MGEARRVLALWGGLLLASGCASASAAATPPTSQPTRPAAAAPAQTGSVEVEVVGLRNAKGQVLASLFRSAEGFPDQVKRAFAKQTASITDGHARLRFEDVPVGEFAIAVHHDEDGNFVMATGFMGVPTEGYGASRDAKARFGPPAYEDARLTLKAGPPMQVRIEMRY